MESMVRLAYGEGEVCFELKHRYSVYTPNLPNRLPDPGLTVERALEQPFHSPAIEDICHPGERVLLVVSDITRPVPYASILPPLLARLAKAGVREEDITVIFANGTHRLMTAVDAVTILGKTLAERLTWVNHDADDKNNQVYLGQTRRGTPVWLNQLALDTDRVILTGAVVHHYFAGFGGGRKCLVPGIAGSETTLANHKLVLGQSGRGLHPNCIPGNLEGNPVHEDIIDACAMRQPDFLLNVVLDPNHRVLHATAGHWQDAHLEACDMADRIYSVHTEGPADLVLASCGGFPKDINLIQAHKTLDNAFRAVAPGKVLIVLAQCRQGVGSNDFLSWFNHSDMNDLEQALQTSYSIHGHTALTCRAKAQRITVILVSSLDPALTRKIGMLPANSIAEALQMAYHILSTQNPKTYIFPAGSLTVPHVSFHPIA